MHRGMKVTSNRRRRQRLAACSTFAALLLLVGPSAQAEIITDGSVGPVTNLSGAMLIPQSLGAARGSNLFHSFATFNIGSAESATFTATDTFSNVISRVTGTTASRINGPLISQIPGADFWFINPNGVTFGVGAQINVPAAFHVSTANNLEFPGSTEKFSADLGQNSTFSVASPEAFGFLGGNGDITFENIVVPAAAPTDLLQLSAFRASWLDISAANIQIDASDIGEIGGDVVGTEGHQEMDIRMVATGADPSIVPLTDALSFSPAGNIRLTTSKISAGDYGSIDLRGGDVSLDNSILESFVPGFEVREAGAIAIEASGDVDILGPSQLVFLTAPFVNLLGSISILSNGAITMAPDAANPFGDGPLLDISGLFGELPGQGIIIRGDSVSLTGTVISAPGAFGSGSSVEIISSGYLELLHSFIGASPNVTNGDPFVGGGDIILRTLNGGDITVRHSLLQTTGNFSLGEGSTATGLVKLDTSGAVSLLNSKITTSADSSSPGHIEIRGSQIILEGDTEVSATRNNLNPNTSDIFGGTGGSIRFEATDRIVLANSVVEARTSGDANVRDGNPLPTPGEVRLTTPLLEFIDDGIDDGIHTESTISTQVNGDIGASPISIGSPGDLVIFSRTGRGVITSSVKCPADDCGSTFSGSGNAGIIEITADNLTLSDMEIFSQAGPDTTGNGGGVALTATQGLSIQNSVISTDTSGIGPAGGILVTAESLEIAGEARISSASRDGSTALVAPQAFPADVPSRPGDAGDITLEVGSLPIDPGSPVSLLIGPGSSVETSSAASAGGNIVVSTDGTVFLDGGIISTSAQGLGEGDKGGDITIAKPELLVLRGAKILAQANQGDGGNITIDTVGLIKVGDSVIDASSENSVDGTVSTYAENTVSAAVVEIEPPGTAPPDALGRRCSPAEVAGRSSFLLRGTRPADIRPSYLPLDAVASAVMGNQSVACAQQVPPR